MLDFIAKKLLFILHSLGGSGAFAWDLGVLDFGAILEVEGFMKGRFGSASRGRTIL